MYSREFNTIYRKANVQTCTSAEVTNIEFSDEGEHELDSLYLCFSLKESFQKKRPTHRMDIASIEIKPKRMSVNTIPSESGWTNLWN